MLSSARLKVLSDARILLLMTAFARSLAEDQDPEAKRTTQLDLRSCLHEASVRDLSLLPDLQARIIAEYFNSDITETRVGTPRSLQSLFDQLKRLSHHSRTVYGVAAQHIEDSPQKYEILKLGRSQFDIGCVIQGIADNIAARDLPKIRQTIAGYFSDAHTEIYRLETTKLSTEAKTRFIADLYDDFSTAEAIFKALNDDIGLQQLLSCRRTIVAAPATRRYAPHIYSTLWIDDAREIMGRQDPDIALQYLQQNGIIDGYSPAIKFPSDISTNPHLAFGVAEMLVRSKDPEYMHLGWNVYLDAAEAGVADALKHATAALVSVANDPSQLFTVKYTAIDLAREAIDLQFNSAPAAHSSTFEYSARRAAPAVAPRYSNEIVRRRTAEYLKIEQDLCLALDGHNRNSARKEILNLAIRSLQDTLANSANPAELRTAFGQLTKATDLGFVTVLEKGLSLISGTFQDEIAEDVLSIALDLAKSGGNAEFRLLVGTARHLSLVLGSERITARLMGEARLLFEPEFVDHNETSTDINSRIVFARNIALLGFDICNKRPYNGPGSILHASITPRQQFSTLISRLANESTIQDQDDVVERVLAQQHVLDDRRAVAVMSDARRRMGAEFFSTNELWQTFFTKLIRIGHSQNAWCLAEEVLESLPTADSISAAHYLSRFATTGLERDPSRSNPDDGPILGI